MFPSVISGRCVVLKKTSAGLMNDKRWEKYSNISRNIMIIPQCLVGWRFTNTTIPSSYHTDWHTFIIILLSVHSGPEMFIKFIFLFSFKSYSGLLIKWKELSVLQRRVWLNVPLKLFPLDFIVWTVRLKV